MERDKCNNSGRYSRKIRMCWNTAFQISLLKLSPFSARSLYRPTFSSLRNNGIHEYVLSSSFSTCSCNCKAISGYSRSKIFDCCDINGNSVKVIWRWMNCIGAKKKMIKGTTGLTIGPLKISKRGDREVEQWIIFALGCIGPVWMIHEHHWEWQPVEFENPPSIAGYAPHLLYYN